MYFLNVKLGVSLNQSRNASFKWWHFALIFNNHAMVEEAEVPVSLLTVASTDPMPQSTQNVMMAEICLAKFQVSEHADVCLEVCESLQLSV